MNNPFEGNEDSGNPFAGRDRDWQDRFHDFMSPFLPKPSPGWRGLASDFLATAPLIMGGRAPRIGPSISPQLRQGWYNQYLAKNPDIAANPPKYGLYPASRTYTSELPGVKPELHRFKFDIMDREGKNVGYLWTSVEGGSPRIRIDNIEAGHSREFPKGRPWFFGPKDLHDLALQGKAFHQEAFPGRPFEDVGGYRVSGARERAGNPSAEITSKYVPALGGASLGLGALAESHEGNGFTPEPSDYYDNPFGPIEQ